MLEKIYSRRARRGMSLLEAALSAGLIVLALSSALTLWTNYVFRLALHAEAREVSALADAAKSHVLQNFDAHVSTARSATDNVIALPISDLIASDSYSPASPQTTTRGRDLAVYVWAPDANTALILAAAQFGTGETGRVGVPRGGKDIHAVGWVAPHSTTQIQGPGLRLDIAAIQSNTVPLVAGDLIGLAYASYGRDLSPYLHRTANALRPELNQMETDLDLGGNDIVGVGSLNATTVTVDGGLTSGTITGVTSVQGPARVTGNLTVSGTTTVTGDLTVTGAASATSLNVAQLLTANNITATTATVDTLTSDQINAANVNASGQVTTPLVNGETLAVDDLTANRIEAALGILDGITQADTLVADTVITGSCSGC